MMMGNYQLERYPTSFSTSMGSPPRLACRNRMNPDPIKGGSPRMVVELGTLIRSVVHPWTFGMDFVDTL